MIFKTIQQKLNKYSFDQVVKGIRQTPAIKYRHCETVTIVSMVSTSTVDMYLLAIKSFMAYFGYGSIEVINDGTLRKQDIDVLHAHIPQLNISQASDIDTGDCPTYISWKRLFRVQQLAQHSYVIQLDSDTISVGNLTKVHALAQCNTGFVVGSPKWSEPVDTQYLEYIVTRWNNTHVQARAESVFNRIEFFKDGTKYLRGCAGFAGYPKSFASVEQITSLSNQIREHVGDDWMKWGSEQTTTLCLISKTPDSQVLPWPYYQNYGFPETMEKPESMNLIHFIGTNRFDTSLYANLARKFIIHAGKTAG